MPQKTSLASLRRKLAATMNTRNAATLGEIATALDHLVTIGEAVLLAEKAGVLDVLKDAPEETRNQAKDLLESLRDWATIGATQLGSTTAPPPPGEPGSEPAPGNKTCTSREFGRMNDRQRREFLAVGGTIAATASSMFNSKRK